MKPTKKRTTHPTRSTITKTTSKATRARKAKRRTPSFLSWSTTSTHAAVVSRSGGQRLGLFITGIEGEFVVGAVAVEGKHIDSMQAVLENHKHHMIGEYKTLVAAMSEAENYGLRWARRELAEAEDCTCVDIEATPPPLTGVRDLSTPGSSMANPLFADAKTPQLHIARARVVVECETNLITKNAFGPTGIPYERPPSAAPAAVAGGQ